MDEQIIINFSEDPSSSRQLSRTALKPFRVGAAMPQIQQTYNLPLFSSGINRGKIFPNYTLKLHRSMRLIST